MRLGFHLSIAGGFSRMISRAQKLGCETIQFFSRSPRAWRDCLVDDEEAAVFRSALRKTDIAPLFLHAPYLLNLATGDEQLYERSLTYLKDELVQGERLGAQYVIVHAGNRMTNTENDACRRVSQGLRRVLGAVRNGVSILVENTAGQGTEIGFSFFQLKKILDGVGHAGRVGICLDTAHAFAAGYDISTKSGFAVMVEEIAAGAVRDRVKVLHLNDTLSPCGSRIDRHWHIGKGVIGLAGFENVINHTLFRELPGIMETPRNRDADDVRNMRTLKRLRAT